MGVRAGLFSVLLMRVALAQAAIPVNGNAPHPDPSKISGGNWSSGVKDLFGTAFEAYDAQGIYSGSSATAPLSKVWFTGAQGVLTEIYWPSVDRAQVRDSQFLVSDGKSFLFEERKDALHEIRWIRPGVPLYVTLNKDPSNRFTIQRTTFTDPDRDAVIVKVRIVRNVPGLKFYYLHNPSVGNTPMGDTAFVNNTDRPGLYAWQGNSAQAVLFSTNIRQASAGFENSNDGYQDLVSDFSMDSHFEWAENGNVVEMAELELPDSPGVSEFTTVIAFAKNDNLARSVGLEALKNADAAQNKYIQQWESYQAGLRDLGAASLDNGTLYRSSIAVLKSLEDKTRPGAFVASPSVPWGLQVVDMNSSPSKPRPIAGCNPRDYSHSTQKGGYHLVWARDLYQIATALLSVGDEASARAALGFLKTIQFDANSFDWQYGARCIHRDGAFPQNVWTDGVPYWDGFQMDQTAYPILLAYRLWKAQAIDLEGFSDMVMRAANFVANNGPWTGQDRWEENHGVSPSTAASEIASLWTASEMAAALGQKDLAQKFKQTADAWSAKPGDNLESWTFTETGALGGGKYYERVEGADNPSQRWDPNDERSFQIGNYGARKREKDVIDGGFIELVRLGVRSALDYHILQSLHVYDQYIRVDTSKGMGFRRYLGDQYGYDEESNSRQTDGMLWPIFTGERGHYELARAIEEGQSAEQVAAVAVPHVSAMENFATPSFMIPEQVWDYGGHQGLPTGAATPLGWSHAEYIKLLASRSDGRLTDLVPLVWARSSALSRTHH